MEPSLLKLNNKSDTRGIEEIVKSVEVDMILELFTRNKENDLDQAINNEVNGEFDFLTELHVKKDNDKASQQQKKKRIHREEKPFQCKERSLLIIFLGRDRK